MRLRGLSMIKRKSIAFNLADPKQREMFKYVEEMTNFSGYGKMLIFNEMNGVRQSINQNDEQLFDASLLKELI